MIFSLLSSHTRRVTRAGVSVRGPATWSLAKSMLIHIETNPNLTSESLCLSGSQYRQLLTSVPEAADAVELIRTLSEMSTVALNQLLEREDQVGGGNDGSGDVSGNQTWWRPEVIATTAVRNLLFIILLISPRRKLDMFTHILYFSLFVVVVFLLFFLLLSSFFFFLP